MVGLLMAPAAAAGKFYDDDPLEHEPAPLNAAQAARRKVSDYFDFIQQTFATPG